MSTWAERMMIMNKYAKTMKRFLYFLLALLGFVVTTTSCRVEYGCPPIEYQPDVEQEEVNKSPEEGSSNPVGE